MGKPKPCGSDILGFVRKNRNAVAAGSLSVLSIIGIVGSIALSGRLASAQWDREANMNCWDTQGQQIPIDQSYEAKNPQDDPSKYCQLDHEGGVETCSYPDGSACIIHHSDSWDHSNDSNVHPAPAPGEGEWDHGDDGGNNLVDERHRKDFLRNVKAHYQPIKDMRRQAKESKNSAAESMIQDYERQVEAVRSCVENASTQDDIWNCEDLEREGNDFQSEIWNALQAGNIRKDIERYLGEKGEMRNMEREVKNLEKKIDVSGLKEILNRIRSEAEEARSLVDSDPQGAQQEMQDVYDAQNEFWQVLQGYQSLEQLGNAEKEFKNMEREITRIRKEGGDVSEAESILNELKAMVSEIKNAPAEDRQYLMQDYWDLQNTFQEAIQGSQRAGERSRMQKEMGRMCEDFKREGKRIQQELAHDKSRSGGVKAEGLVGKVEQLVQECQRIVAEATERLESGEEHWSVQQDMQYAIQDLWEEFQRINESRWEDRACEDAERGLEEAERGVTQDAPQMIEGVREENPDVAEELEELVAQAKEIIEQGWSDIDAGNCQDAMEALDRMNFELRDEFFRLMEEVGGFGFEGGPEFVDYEDEYREFHDEYDFEDFDEEDLIKNFHERGYGGQALDLMRRIAGEVLEGYLKHQQGGEGPDLINSATNLGLGSAEVQELLRVKNELLDDIQGLRDQIAGLRKELAGIVEQVQQFTFGPKTAVEAKRFIEEELPTLSKAEAEDRLKELKQGAREEHYDDGRLAFTDIEDLTVWYADDALRAKGLGLVQGTDESDGTEVEPGKDVNYTEALVMVARAVGIDEDAEPSKGLAATFPEWSHSAIGTLEDRGVEVKDIVEGARPSDAISRPETALLIAQAFDLPDVDVSGANIFKDTGKLTTEVKEAIAAVKKAGIMTGEGDGKNFGLGPLNKASLMKVLVEGAEELGIEEEEGYEEEEEYPYEEYEEEGYGGKAGGGGYDEEEEYPYGEYEDEYGYEEEEEPEHEFTPSPESATTRKAVKPSRRAILENTGRYER